MEKLAGKKSAFHQIKNQQIQWKCVVKLCIFDLDFVKERYITDRIHYVKDCITLKISVTETIHSAWYGYIPYIIITITGTYNAFILFSYIPFYSFSLSKATDINSKYTYNFENKGCVLHTKQIVWKQIKLKNFFFRIFAKKKRSFFFGKINYLFHFNRYRSYYDHNQSITWIWFVSWINIAIKLPKKMLCVNKKNLYVIQYWVHKTFFEELQTIDIFIYLSINIDITIYITLCIQNLVAKPLKLTILVNIYINFLFKRVSLKYFYYSSYLVLETLRLEQIITDFWYRKVLYGQIFELFWCFMTPSYTANFLSNVKSKFLAE